MNLVQGGQDDDPAGKPKVSIRSRLRADAILTRANIDFRQPHRVPLAFGAVGVWGRGIVGAVASSAARYPWAHAVVDPYGALTYSELWRRAGQLARGLVDEGVAPGTRVGILARNSREYVLALVAVARTGADMVFLNTDFAAPQLADVVAAEGIEFLLHEDEFEGLVADCGARHTFGEAAQAAIALRRGFLAPRRQGSLIVLTSGTTGRPKGAARSSAAESVEGLAGLLSRIPYGPRDTQIVVAPLFHGWGLTNLLLGLARASTTVLSRHFDPRETLRSVSGHRAHVLVVVPVMLQRILALGTSALLAADTTRLRVIAASGSALGPALATETLNRFGAVLYNVYGSTEVALATIATPAELRSQPGTAGRRVLGARVEILDGQGRPVPAGDTGRIFVGSSMRFDGYTSGGAKEEQRGLLASGDIGHFEGELLFVEGREDDMIVSGGENVYPQEVEELLAEHSGIAEVAVVGVPDSRFGQALRAFVVTKPGATLDEDAVQLFVREQLARFKVPRTVRFLEQLPRNATGKVLRRELRSA